MIEIHANYNSSNVLCFQSCAIEISGDTKTRSDEPKERSLEFWRCGFACLVFLTGQIAGMRVQENSFGETKK